jgi:hypothetical protein
VLLAGQFGGGPNYKGRILNQNGTDQADFDGASSAQIYNPDVFHVRADNSFVGLELNVGNLRYTDFTQTGAFQSGLVHTTPLGYPGYLILLDLKETSG